MSEIDAREQARLLRTLLEDTRAMLLPAFGRGRGVDKTTQAAAARKVNGALAHLTSLEIAVDLKSSEYLK